MAKSPRPPAAPNAPVAGSGPKGSNFPTIPSQDLRNFIGNGRDISGAVPGHDFRGVDDAPIFDRKPVRPAKGE